MLGRTCRGLLLLGILSGVAGCAEQLKPLSLNTFAASNNRKIAKSATEVRQKLLQLQAGKNVPPAQVRAAIDGLRSTVVQVRTETNKYGPDYLPAAGDFYATYVGFLDGQQRLLDEEFPKILKVVDGPGGPGQKWNQIAPILAKIEKDEAADLARLHEVQKKLAEGGGFLAPGGY